MSWIDAVIVVIFLYFIVTAFSAGFVREIIGISSAILGIVLAGFFYDNVANTLLSAIDNKTTASVIAFLVIFGGLTIGGQVLGMLVHPAISILQLGMVDQLLGAAFGAVKAFIIIEALIILFITFPRYNLDDRIRDSEFASILVDASAPIQKILPDVFNNAVDAFEQ